MRRRNIAIPIERTQLVFGGSWLLTTSAMLWIIATLYVPIMAPTLRSGEQWSVAVGIVAAFIACLIVHATAHAWAARRTASKLPSSLPLYPFGDAAQVWPAARDPWREALVAIAGPATNILIAGLAYLLWDQQLHPYLDTGAIFLAVANTAIALVNLAPGFPLDGARLTRVAVWGLAANRRAATTALGVWLGWLLIAFLAGWGAFLIAQRARFSMENGIGTLTAAGILAWALWQQPAWKWDQPSLPDHPTPSHTLPGALLRALGAGALILVLLGIVLGLVPTNHGLEAPGIALSVEPMIDLPADYRHSVTGTFILTTVIPQTPITAGQWAYAKISPVVRLVPPERIVPPDTTPQEIARRGSLMLAESEVVAAVVGLRLAGYDAEITGQAAEVLSVLPESPAYRILQPGDWVVELNGEAVKTAEGLANRIREQDPDATINLVVDRNGKRLEYTLPLMSPEDPDEPPRLGIGVQTVGFDADLPFPVQIVPQKISGGPSAGLVFTLAVYNLVTPENLTGGRKIAGTGTINRDGEVGPIGGVELKVAGAERAGAEYFLVPPENYADASSVARRIQVVEIATAQQAIDFLRELLAKSD